MVDALEQNPDAAVALSRNVIAPVLPFPEKITAADFFQRHFSGDSPIGVGPSAAIIRCDCFETAGGLKGRHFVGEDRTLAETGKELAHRCRSTSTGLVATSRGTADVPRNDKTRSSQRAFLA